MELVRQRSSGQVFMIAAVLFSSLTVLLFVTTSDTSQNQTQYTVKNFYENTFSKTSETLNEALSENYSIDSARNHLYSYSRFIDRSATSKGIDFEASYLVVMPQKGKSIFINYRSTDEQARLYNSKTGWSNTSVSSRQYLEESFSAGKTNFQIVLPEYDVNRSFTASSPRIFTHMIISAQDQKWVNSELS